MPSPFPGMDPYLEDPARDFHTRFLVALADTVEPRVAPQFEVSIEERVYVSQTGLASPQRFVPDLIVTRPAERALAPTTVGSSGGVVSPSVLVERISDEEIRERYLEIRDARSQRVVTIIELLSPSNKQSGSASQS